MFEGSTRARAGLSAALVAATLTGGCTDDVDPTAPPLVSSAAVEAATTITPENMEGLIRSLAHDSLKGRGNFRPELDQAAAFIAARFREAGLAAAGVDGFFQPFEMTRLRLHNSTVRLEYAGQPLPLTYGRDYFMAYPVGTRVATAPVLWGGTVPLGTPALAGLDLNSEVVLLDHPDTTIDLGWWESVYGAEDPESFRPIDGASAVGLVLSDPLDEADVARWTDAFARTRSGPPVFALTEAAAADLVAAAGTDLTTLRAGGPEHLGGELKVGGYDRAEHAEVSNVVGVLEGSDPDLRARYVAVVAHYDNRDPWLPDEDGDSIANGADANASGVAAMLEIARALGTLETPPKRSVLFLATAGRGLGANQFLAETVVPPESIEAVINLERISRSAHGNVTVTGLWHTTMGEVLRNVGRDRPDVRLNVEPDSRGAYTTLAYDGGHFLQSRIPTVLLHRGGQPDHGKPGDEVELVDAAKAARVARLALYAAHTVANDTATVDFTPYGLEQIQGWLP